MQTNQYDYDTRASWMPPQNQPYTGRYVTSPDGRPQFVPQPRPQYPAQTQRPTGQKPRAPQKMPKERAIALADRLKRAFAIVSLLGFGTLSGLVAFHQVATTTTTQSTQSSSGSSSSNSSNSTNSSSQSSNNFLNQQGGNTSGSSSSSSSSSSSTVSGTHSS